MTKNNINKSSVRLSEKTVVISVVTLVVMICLAVGIFFYSRWHEEKVVLVLERWGNVGDFFGGILNPIIGLGGVILLAYTLIQNQKALSETAQIMKSQADLIQHDHRRQSLINIMTSFKTDLATPTQLKFQYNEVSFSEATIGQLFDTYSNHVLDKNIPACIQFYEYIERWLDITFFTSLYAAKRLVDEEPDPNRRDLLIIISLAFVPLTALLIMYSYVRSNTLKDNFLIVHEQHVIDFLVECIEKSGFSKILDKFDKEAVRAAKKSN